MRQSMESSASIQPAFCPAPVSVQPSNCTPDMPSLLSASRLLAMLRALGGGGGGLPPPPDGYCANSVFRSPIVWRQVRLSSVPPVHRPQYSSLNVKSGYGPPPGAMPPLSCAQG